MNRKQIIEQVAKKLDAQIDFIKIGEWLKEKIHPAWGDLVIGIAAKQFEKRDYDGFVAFIEFIYANAPEKYHNTLDTVFEAYATGDYSNVDDALVEEAVSAIKTGFGDDLERIWIKAVFGAIMETVMLKTVNSTNTANTSVGGGSPGGNPGGGGG